MIELLLPFIITPSPVKISYTDKIFLIGSCFTEEIGNYLKDLKFDVVQNPNGILYDPISIATALHSYIEPKIFKEDELFLLNELWQSWQHHSLFSNFDKEKTLRKINDSQHTAHQYLKNASWLLVTLGSAYNYNLKSGKPVANCHKAPADIFKKKLISIEEIISNLSSAIAELKSFNAGIKIIFTVSPVRHIRDGVAENNRSKARLIEAVHSIIEQHNHIYYFPAYEIVIDVLRDYRFFKSDLVHVNEVAVQYVFEIFCDTYFNETTLKLKRDIDALMKAKNHKPFNEDSAGHKIFLKAQLNKTHELITKYPGIFFEEELKYFSGKD